MNILYFTWISLEPKGVTGNGVHKKIYAQIEALKQNRNNVYLGFQVGYNHYRIVGDDNYKDFIDIDENKFYCKLIEFIKSVNIEVAYIRNHALLTVRRLTTILKRNNVKVLLEIPTYPFIRESINGKNKLINCLRLAKYHIVSHVLGFSLDRIVTYSDDKKIWGIKTINISNGINPDNVKLSNRMPSDIIRITAVANPAFWHGYDRLIEGCREYLADELNCSSILITIVGGDEPNKKNNEFHRLKELVNKYQLNDVIKFTGQLYGDALDKIFDNTDICVGSLGRHRSGNKKMKALKNVEYAMRGLPFCYSEDNSDFDGAEYVYKVPQDDSPVEIKQLINFVKSVRISPQQIRTSVSHLSWVNQMRKVCAEAACLINKSF